MYKKYWEKYYKSNKASLMPSLFAQFVLKNYLKKNNSLIELGCGNGRDSIFFARYGIKTTSIDQCEKEISNLNKNNTLPNLKFICKDFSKLCKSNSFDNVYLRFSLHSVPEKEEDKVIKWAYENLNKSGYLFIEARGKKNELYKLGTPVAGEKDSYIYENHYRRFIDIKNLCEKITSAGFFVKYSSERSGFSPLGSTNYKFIRVIAYKK